MLPITCLGTGLVITALYFIFISTLCHMTFAHNNVGSSHIIKNTHYFWHHTYTLNDTACAKLKHHQAHKVWCWQSANVGTATVMGKSHNSSDLEKGTTIGYTGQQRTHTHTHTKCIGWCWLILMFFDALKAIMTSVLKQKFHHILFYR